MYIRAIQYRLTLICIFTAQHSQFKKQKEVLVVAPFLLCLPRQVFQAALTNDGSGAFRYAFGTATASTSDKHCRIYVVVFGGAHASATTASGERTANIIICCFDASHNRSSRSTSGKPFLSTGQTHPLGTKLDNITIGRFVTHAQACPFAPRHGSIAAAR